MSIPSSVDRVHNTPQVQAEPPRRSTVLQLLNGYSQLIHTVRVQTQTKHPCLYTRTKTQKQTQTSLAIWTEPFREGPWQRITKLKNARQTGLRGPLWQCAVTDCKSVKTRKKS